MATGDNLKLGVANQADKTTVLHGLATNRPGLRVNTGTGSTSISVFGFSNFGTGVKGESPSGHGGTGVWGLGDWGVRGHALNIGIWGTASGANGIGVVGAGPAIGLWGASQGLAGRFDGDVFVNGSFTQTGGSKSAAVPFPDGSLRRLYSVESPESWFEDFGEQKLVKGRAEVAIDPKFAAVVRGPYHLFLTPYGDSKGLYVATRRRKGFVVREQGGGQSTLVFSYRIVARRKDIAGTRFEKVTRPSTKLPVPRPPKKVRIPRTA